MTDNETLMLKTFTDIEIKAIQNLKMKATHVLDGFSHIFGNQFDTFILTGGVFASWYHAEAPKDYDVYILNDGRFSFTDIIQTLQANVFHGSLRNKSSDYIRDNKKILEVWEGLDSVNRKFQLIFTDYHTREELIKDFDYAHCMVTYSNTQLHITRKTYDAIRNKHLIVNNAKNQQMWRKDKFLQRGFTVPKYAPVYA